MDRRICACQIAPGTQPAHPTTVPATSRLLPPCFSHTDAKIPSLHQHFTLGQNTTMITIYHNPRCSKSRGACELIANTCNVASEPVEIVEYLKQPLSASQLSALNGMLECPVRDMLRDTETAYRELGLDNAELSDDQLYEAIEKHPVLMQRPIIVRKGRAVIGRPPENVKALFE